MNFLGIDIGTGSVKVCLLNEQGNIIYTAQNFYTTNEPETGYQESDPKKIAQQVFLLLKNIPSSSNSICICFSSHMHSLMAVDKNNEPLTQLMLWSDTRSINEAEEVIKNGKVKDIYIKSGVPVHPMLPLTKIMWLQKHQPEIFYAAYKFISIKEFIFYHFIKEYVVDYSVAASTGMFDMTKLDWNDDALFLANINKEKLSRIVSSKWSTNKIDISFLNQLNLPTNTTIVIGSSDGCLANIGSNIIPEKEISLTIGTSAAVRITSHKKNIDKDYAVFNYLLDENFFVCGGASNNGGNVIDWIKKKYDYQNTNEILQDAFSTPPGCEGLIIVPYFLGERAPVWNARAKEIIHTDKDNYPAKYFARATLEGMVMNLFLIAEKIIGNNLSVTKIVAGGGFIQSDEWVQLVADVFNLPVAIYSNADVSALGAAIWGGYCVNYFSLNDEKIFSAKQEKIFYPNLINHQVYQKNYSTFKEFALTQNFYCSLL